MPIILFITKLRMGMSATLTLLPDNYIESFCIPFCMECFETESRGKRTLEVGCVGWWPAGSSRPILPLFPSESWLPLLANLPDLPYGPSPGHRACPAMWLAVLSSLAGPFWSRMGWGGGFSVKHTHTHRNTDENTSKDVDIEAETQSDTHAAPHEWDIIKVSGQLCGRDSNRGFQQHRADQTFMLREPCFFFSLFFCPFHYTSSQLGRVKSS